ncbi:MAG: hypothetical protein ABIA97_03370 [Candidatus Omnitrophota bacterium]
MMKKRSVGVTVFGIITMLSYFISSFIRLMSAALNTKSISVAHFVYAFLSPFNKSLIRTVAFLIFLTFFFILGYNILKLKLWAYKAIRVVAVFQFMVGIFTLLTNAPLPMHGRVMLIILGATYFYFFTRPKVKEQFSAKKIGGK